MRERLIQKKSESPDNNKQRKRFAVTITVLAQNFYQSVLVDNPGTYRAISDSFFGSVPILDFITGGDLALAQGLNGRIPKAELIDDTVIGAKVEARINELPLKQVQEGQRAIDKLIDTAFAINFPRAQRLKPYLQIVLPDTREGLQVLKEISAKVRDQITSETDIEKMAENFSSLEQTLKLLEDEFIKRIMLDPNNLTKIQELVKSQARVKLLEAVYRDDSEHINGLKSEIVQRRIAGYRDNKVIGIIDGKEREFSQLDSELYQVIEEKKLMDRLPEAKEQLVRRIEQGKAEVVDVIIKRRVIRKVAGLMLSDQDLRVMGAKVAGLSEDEILALADDQGISKRSQIASQLLVTHKRKFLKLGLTNFPNFERIFDEERKKLDQAIESGDPFLFATQLDPRELDSIRKRVPNIFRKMTSAENRAVYAFAKEELQKKLAAETTEDELIELLAEKLFRNSIKKLSQEKIDRAVRNLSLDPQGLINNPFKLFDSAEDVLVAAQKDNEASSLFFMNVAEQVGLEEDIRTLTVSFPQFKPIIASLPKSEELEQALERSEVNPENKSLGHIAIKEDILSSDGPFHYFPEYRIQYPEIVVQALGQLFAEYNFDFTQLVEANREWTTDYQYCLTGPGGSPVNYFVQIDMIGLPDGYLQTAANLDQDLVREDLRKRIFEIENSVAMYQLLEKMFSREGQPSNFDLRFRQGLEDLRQLHKRPIALLAVTKEKYRLMKGSEFGKQAGDPLIDEEVASMSGFDKFFGPDEFEAYLRQNGGECDYLLYVRSSEPVLKLRNPGIAVAQPLLRNPDLRRVIKANAITFNIDNPDLPLGSPRLMNDTKAYLLPMGMAYPVYSFRDFKSPKLAEFLKSRGEDTALIESGQAVVRAKPMQSSYGCYGHLRGKLADGEFRQRLIRELRRRGPYVIQPEMDSTIIINDTDGKEYTYIDRNFLSFTNGVPRFLGGERTLMLINSPEAERGRIHGNESSITAEIF